MLRVSSLSAAQKDTLFSHLLHCEIDAEFQHDGAVIAAQLPVSALEDVKTADLKAVLAPAGHAPAPSPASPDVLPLHALLKLIDEIYQERWKQACNHTDGGAAPITDDLAVHAYRFLSAKYGVDALVRRHSNLLVEGVRRFRETDLEVQIFGVLMSSGAYDTADVKAFLKWKFEMMPFGQSKLDAQGVPRRVVSGSSVASLVGRVLRDDTGLRNVTFAALGSLERLGMPQIMADPNTYCPPFRTDNPYVCHGASSVAVPPRFRGDVVVIQLLCILLLNAKQRRLDPKTPAMRATPSGLSPTLLTPTFASAAKLKQPRTKRVMDLEVGTLDYSALEFESEQVAVPDAPANEESVLERRLARVVGSFAT